MDEKVARLIEEILQLDQVERLEFIAGMKDGVQRWKEKASSELRWMEQLEKLGFK